MKIALIGKGKTGSKILELVPKEQVTVFDSKNPPSSTNLKGHDVIICFVTGEVFYNLIPILVESKIPLVTGATGFKWPKDFNQTLVANKTSWISGTNFSLGMRLINEMIKSLSKAPILFEQFKFNLHEIHHTKKIDAPSGTALSWKEWLGMDLQITSERTGDVVGDHKMTLDTGSEKIIIQHEALDRKIFAQGALWAANYLLSNKLNPGLYKFEEIASNQLKSNI